MSIVISLLIGGLCGGVIGFGIAVIMSAAGRYDDQEAMAITLLRRENARLHDQINTSE